MRSTPDKATDFEKLPSPPLGRSIAAALSLRRLLLPVERSQRFLLLQQESGPISILCARQSKASTFIRVVSLGSIPDDGIPRLFPIVSDRLDAWTGFPSEPIGAVYLSREKGSPQVKLFRQSVLMRVALLISLHRVIASAVRATIVLSRSVER